MRDCLWTYARPFGRPPIAFKGPPCVQRNTNHRLPVLLLFCFNFFPLPMPFRTKHRRRSGSWQAAPKSYGFRLQWVPSPNGRPDMTKPRPPATPTVRGRLWSAYVHFLTPAALVQPIFGAAAESYDKCNCTINPNLAQPTASRRGGAIAPDIVPTAHQKRIAAVCQSSSRAAQNVLDSFGWWIDTQKSLRHGSLRYEKCFCPSILASNIGASCGWPTGWSVAFCALSSYAEKGQSILRFIRDDYRPFPYRWGSVAVGGLGTESGRRYK